MKKFIALLVLSLLGLGATFYVFPAQRSSAPDPQPETETENAALTDTSEANRAAAPIETTEENDVQDLLEQLRRERLESEGIPLENDSEETNDTETEVEEEEEEDPSGFDRDNPSGTYTGTWENIHLNTSGTMNITMDEGMIRLSNNGGGGDYIPAFDVNAEIDLVAETISLNGLEVVGDLEGASSEDLSFWFTLTNIPNQPFDAYAVGQMSEDGRTLSGNIWTFPAGSTAITSVEACEAAAICHQNNFSASLQ